APPTPAPPSAPGVLPHGELRRLELLLDLRLPCHLVLSLRGRRAYGRGPLEREPQRDQQPPAFIVRLRRRRDGDVHPPDLHHLVVVDLRENQLLGQPEGVIPVAVERPSGQAPGC